MERHRLPRMLRLAAAFAVTFALSPVASAHAQHLGNPTMRVDTYKIVPYYDADFDTSVNAANWPAVTWHERRTQATKDAAGRIALHSVYDQNNSVDDIAASWADDTGLLGASSRRDDTYSWDEYCGVLTDGLWAQSFRKDVAGATLTLQLSPSLVYVFALFGQARAEFTFEAEALRAGNTFFTHRDAAATRGNFGFPTTFDDVVSSTRTMVVSQPNGNNAERQLAFAGASVPVDLSSVPVGAEFTLRCHLVTEATISTSEVARAHAAFGDEPTATGGLQLSTSGLTPMNNPVLPPQPAAVGGAGASRALALSAPHPNPSPDGVRFELELGRADDVSVEVYDMTGRRVATLANGVRAAGRHAFAWDGRDGAGLAAAPGVYAVRAQAGSDVATRRVVKLAEGR